MFCQMYLPASRSAFEEEIEHTDGPVCRAWENIDKASIIYTLKAKELAKKVLNSISASDRKQLIDQLRLRTDEKGKFYLRFDKQIAFEKEKMILTSEEDTIQIVFSLEAYPAKYENYLDVAKELISENR